MTQTISRLPETLQGLEVGSINDMFTVLQAAIGFGYTGEVSCTGFEDGNPVYRLRINNSVQGDQFAVIGDWAAIEGATTVLLLPGSTFASIYTTDVPLQWAALATGPIATVVGAGAVMLTFPQPTSPNGPFTYSLNGPGTADGPTIDAEGNVSTTISGLSPGESSWTIGVSTTYSDVPAATSAVSNTITI